jgi:hypothetical protein
VDIPDLLDPLVFLDQREIREHLPVMVLVLKAQR